MLRVRLLVHSVMALAGLSLSTQLAQADGDTMKLGRVQATQEKDKSQPEDTELTRHRGYYGGHHHGFYYGGYYSRPYYYGGYRTYYTPSYYYSYPTYGTYYYSAPAYPVYPVYSGCTTYYYPISGTSAPTVALGQMPSQVPPATSTTPSASSASRQFRYDGGPQNPVPKPAPSQLPPAKTEPAKDDAGLLKVSLPATPAEKPALKYPAYGEKR